EVELERLRLEAESIGAVRDTGDVEVGLRGDRADGGELVARHLDLSDAGIRERFEPRVVLAPRMPERDELHGRHCTRAAGLPRRAAPGGRVSAAGGRARACARLGA